MASSRASIAGFSVIPAELSHQADLRETYAVIPEPLTMITYMFLHGGWLHLIGNMLFLWVFGDNVEDRLGVPLYLFLYFFSGFAAAYTQVLIDPQSQVPLIGASGAISGVLGAYLVFFPGVEVRGIIPIGYYIQSVRWPAIAVLGLWFALQLFYALFSLGGGEGGGVAFFAHVGGFVAGMVIAWLVTLAMPQPPEPERNEMLYQRARRYPY